MVLISNLTEKTQVRYVAVKLTGSSSNRNGLGAVVKVTAGGVTYTKVFDGNSGYLSHSLYPLYFGLGAAQAVDGIEVLWPSGKKQTVAGPFKMNSMIEVKRVGRARERRKSGDGGLAVASAFRPKAAPAPADNPPSRMLRRLRHERASKRGSGGSNLFAFASIVCLRSLMSP